METFDEKYQLERFSKTKEEFDFYYENELKEKVDILEKERQETIDLAKKTGLKLLWPALAVLVIYFIYSDIIFYAIAALFVFGGYLFKDVISKRKALSKKMKQEVVTDLVLFMNDNFTYKPNHYLSPSNFRNANIFKQKPNRYSGDDLIKGYVTSEPDSEDNVDTKPPRTDISFSEVQADAVERYKDKDGKTQERVHSIFKGLFFKADFNKDFDGLTIIVPKERSFKGFSFFKKEKENQLHDVELEDIEFMDKFTVKTTDQILARYILTPNFMNRLLDFSNRDHGMDTDDIKQPTSIKEAFQLGLSNHHSDDAYSDTPYFSFRDGTMYFMLPTEKDHFEFNVLSPLNKSLIYSYFKDINIALGLVDELNLNLRIWSKQ